MQAVPKQEDGQFSGLARQEQQHFVQPSYNNFFVAAAPEKPQWKISNFTAVNEQPSFVPSFSNQSCNAPVFKPTNMVYKPVNACQAVQQQQCSAAYSMQSETYSSTYAGSSKCRSEISANEQFPLYAQAGHGQRQSNETGPKQIYDVPQHLIKSLSEDEIDICKQVEVLAFD